jgi:tellurite resistance protein
MIHGLDMEVDGRTAAVIAAGMQAVALADGEAHPREMALIQGFRQQLPAGVDPSGVVLEDDRLRDVFVRFLVLVALVDGDLKAQERATISELAQAHGVSSDRVEQIVGEVRREMFSAFEGVSAFREQALGEADRLGLDRADADAILGE